MQLPLPEQIDEDRVIRSIDPIKDVDGFHPFNAGHLLQGSPTFVAATPAGIMEILREYEVELKGARAVVIGRSNIVGKPMALLLLAEHATVTICHSRTRDLAGGRPRGGRPRRRGRASPSRDGRHGAGGRDRHRRRHQPHRRRLVGDVAQDVRGEGGPPDAGARAASAR